MYSLIAAAALLSVAVLRLLSHPASAPVMTASDAGGQFFSAALEGVTPGAEIVYRIVPSSGKAVNGKTTADATGRFLVPALVVDPAEKAALTYDITVQNPGKKDPVSFTLKLDRETGKIKIAGNGLDDFAAVKIDGAGNTVKTNADWAGLFKSAGMWDLDPAKTSAVQVSMYANPGKDIGKNPLIVKVLSAPGGGTFNPGGVHGYTNLWCGEFAGGRTLPSTCDAPSMPPHNISLGPGTAHMQGLSFHIMDNYVRAMIMMGDELTVMLMDHIYVIGALIDAKQQLEAEREFNILAAEAHRDYHPSDTMCRFGSFIKSVPQAEQKSSINKQAFSEILMTEYTNEANSSASEGYALDIEGRIRQFRHVYCDPRDNNDGLAYMCEHDQARTITLPGDIGLADPDGIGPPLNDPPPLPSGADPPPRPSSRINKDINYARTADLPLTLNVDFTDGDKTDDEEDVIALARNLYWPRVLEPGPWKDMPGKNLQTYFDVRHILAVQNVAHNSFSQIVGMKSRTDPGPADSPVGGPVGLPGSAAGWNFMKAMIRELGIPDGNNDGSTDDEINALLGDYPSYYAQMEVLTKKLYQTPDFYTNLIDKPVNLHRINAALDTIRIMQQHDQLESRMRQEMLTSLLVETALQPEVEKINGRVAGDIRNMRE